jgi:hypothetical protein
VKFRLKKDSCPDHLFEEVRAGMREWFWLIPAWVDHLLVVYQDNDDNMTLSVVVTEEYRSGHVIVGPGWVRVPPAERSQYVMHEILHCSTNHLFTVFTALLEACEAEGTPLAKWAEEEARKAIERTTTDLEHCLMHHLHPEKEEEL